MTTLREAAQQALEALQLPCPRWNGTQSEIVNAAITALRAALAEPPHHQYPLQSDRMRVDPVTGDVGIGTPQRPTEPVQEPVAWYHVPYPNNGISPMVSLSKHHEPSMYGAAMPLYTAPPQRKPLTDEEIRGFYYEHAKYQEAGARVSGWWAFARAIERAHGVGGDDE